MTNLKFRRIELGLTQYELSEATSIARWKIQLIENFIYSPTTAERERINSALGISKPKKGKEGKITK